MPFTENDIRIQQKVSELLASGTPRVLIHSFLASEGLEEAPARNLINLVVGQQAQAKALADGPVPTTTQSFAQAFGTTATVTHAAPLVEAVQGAPVAALDVILKSTASQPVTIREAPAPVIYTDRDQVPTVAAPIPIWEGHPSFIDLGDRKARVVAKTMSNPNVIVFEDVLSAEECEEIIRLSEASLQRSTTVGAKDGTSEVHPSRTSTGTSFTKGQTPLIAAIEERLAKLARWPVERGEAIQILNYQVEQEYKPHHDYFDPTNPASVNHIGMAGNRVATMIMYLNDVEEGGSTAFPNIGLHVMPKAGTVVFFSYGRPHQDSKSLHGGSPVIKGQKWIATKWLRERAWP